MFLLNGALRNAARGRGPRSRRRGVTHSATRVGRLVIVSPGERAAYLFAKKQSRTPWEINDDDVQQLIEHFGPERTLDVIWWSCRCHFMTCVADGFQLPLERENVFQPPAPPKPATEETKPAPSKN